MNYVSYGSNLHPIRLKKRTPSAQLLGTAKLAEMSLRFHKRGNTDRSAKCNIVPQIDSCVYVAIFEVPESEIPLLDRAEGLGQGYERGWVTLENYGDCLTYLAAPTHIDEDLKPFTWYKELVMLGCEVHGFPQAYIDHIRSIPAIQDPHPTRHADQMQLVNEIRSSAQWYNNPDPNGRR